ncbi:putative LRR containing protein [Trachipleistophora hominis]|uniref:Putative LRR containing protein n=1 Tax=Trachipleistophora hominis TaxID=72359 RepID=L7JWT7_TRAHO|nr:putative LRR containing protein [Trachipleistophora hominis]
MCIDEPTIIINEGCQHLFVSKCMCGISLVKSIFIEKLELSHCKKMIETNADQGKMLRVLRLIKNCIDPWMPIYGNIKKIYIHNNILIVQRANHLLIPSDCNNVILRNRIGTIDLSGFIFGALYTGMKTINFEYYFDNLERVHYLHFFSGSINIDSNFFGCNQKHKLLLENVKISGDSILLINEKCISIRVVNCTGSINIPKVLNKEDDLLLGLDVATRFYFIKQQSGKYYMRMCNVEIKETTVPNKKVEVVVLENIKSRNGAVILFDKSTNQFIMSNCDVPVHQQALGVNNNIIRLWTSNVCYRLLNGHIFRANKFSAKICRLSQTATRLIINGCQIDSGYRFGIDSSCKYVYITGYRGTFVLFRSLSEETINVQFNGDSRFIFIKKRFCQDYIMQLYECILKSTRKIEINVKHLILKNVPISNEYNQATTGNLQWSSFFKLDDLQSIVLINIEKFNFRKCVNLNYLRLESITINQNVSFSKSLKVLELINVTLTERGRLKLHRNLKKFYISGGTGENLSRQFFNTDITKSCDGKISSQRNAKSQEKLCCYLVSIDFQRSFYVPEETETLTLENIKMQEGQVLKINTNCKSLKIV